MQESQRKTLSRNCNSCETFLNNQLFRKVVSKDRISLAKSYQVKRTKQRSSKINIKTQYIDKKSISTKQRLRKKNTSAGI